MDQGAGDRSHAQDDPWGDIAAARAKNLNDNLLAAPGQCRLAGRNGGRAHLLAFDDFAPTGRSEGILREMRRTDLCYGRVPDAHTSPHALYQLNKLKIEFV